MRTAYSDTFAGPSGSYVAEIFPHPINFKTTSGGWAPISTSLAAIAGGFQASSSTVPVSLPTSLSSPVTVGSASASVSFRLLGASAPATSTGSGALYPSALPGVDATYRPESDGLDETLSLGSASAPSSYRYALTTTGGLTARLAGGTVQFVDAGGAIRYVMPPAFVRDSASGAQPDYKAVSYSLSSDGTTLTESIDPSWLGASERVFPVALDPTVVLADAGDCPIISGADANTPQCSEPLYIGSQASPAETAR